MQPLDILKTIQAKVGKAHTLGISEARIKKFLALDPNLGLAIKMANGVYDTLCKDELKMLKYSEEEVLQKVQNGIENFYPEDSLSPFLPLAASGPWIITAYGSVVYDAGSYGMLGLGHNYPAVLRALSKPYVMANVMTPSLSQKRFITCLHKEIGHTRAEELRNPYSKFMCLNSGSEAVCLAARIADVNAKLQVQNSPKPRSTRILVIVGAFHGRTSRAAQASHSSLATYKKYLNSFQNMEQVLTVPQNDIDALCKVFARAEQEDFFIEAFFIEPVMGEGDPGRALTREFYDMARILTLTHQTMLIVDSIQAGLRSHGVLSLMDYPGFQEAIPPDIETFSKALNAGNYPLSVVALNNTAARLYRKGIYGNTMTANPRALEVAVAVLESISPAVKRNVQIQGKKLLDALTALMERSDNMISEVVGTGLLLSMRLNHSCCAVSGRLSSEEFVRKHGLNLVHGGQNSLRLTPYFLITDEEIDLIVTVLDEALRATCINTAGCCRSLMPQEFVQYY